MTSPTTFPDLAEPTHRLLGLLERMREHVAEVGTGDVDAQLLHSAMTELPGEVQAFSDVLSEHLKECREIRTQLDSPAKRQKFFEGFEADDDTRRRAAVCVERTRDQVRFTEGIVDGLFKVTSTRSKLEGAVEPSVRRSVAQALTKTTVSVGKVSQGLEELGKALMLFETSGLVAKVGTSSTEREPTETSSASSKSEKKPAGKDTLDGIGLRKSAAPEPEAPEAPPPGAQQDAGSTENAPARPATTAALSKDTEEEDEESLSDVALESCAQEPVPAAKEVTTEAAKETRKSSEVSSPGKAKKLSPRAFRRFQAALVHWAKWHPLAAPRLASAVGVVEAEMENAVQVKLEAWWSEKAPKGDEGDDREDTASEGLRPRTTYKSVDYDGELQTELFTLAGTEPLHVRSLGGEGDNATLLERCLKEVSEWTHTDAVREAAKEFYATAAQKKDSEGKITKYEHLCRARVEFSKIPVLHMKCGFKDPAHPKAGRLFDAWMYGSERKLRFRRIPKQWTWKATAWTFAFVLLGMPFGYLLSKLF